MSSAQLDFSLTPRSEVPEAYKWRATDMFASETDWRAELEAVKPLADGLEALAKGWTESAQALLEETEALERLVQRFLQWAKPLEPQCVALRREEVAQRANISPTWYA